MAALGERTPGAHRIMSVKQEILKLARAAGLQKPEVKSRRIKGGTYWVLEAQNPYREDWDGNPKEVVLGVYRSLEQARELLPDNAASFIEQIKREGLEECPQNRRF